MERIKIAPRPGYMGELEKIGFVFHKEYWLENAYYRFSVKEVEELEQAINNCYQMYCNVAEACLYDEEKLDKLCIPKEMRPFIRQSWEDDDLSLYGRFDFAYVDGVPKLLEFNADTPTTLIESALVQWQWKEAVFPEADQFNSLHEALIQSWKDIHDVYKCDIYHFASLTDCPEDYSTMAYIMSTAYDAGLRTAELDLRDIAIGECLMTPDGEPINCLFKLYPWETMFKENMGGCVTDMCWIEPLWKCLMSNKALLPFLYEMYPDSPYVLPAYFEADKLKSYCKKPIFLGKDAMWNLSETVFVWNVHPANTAKKGMFIRNWRICKIMAESIRFWAAGLSAEKPVVWVFANNRGELRLMPAILFRISLFSFVS